jgi:transcription antitermination factor NusG
VRTLEPLQPRRMLRDLIMVRRALRANPELQTAKPLAKGRLVRIISGSLMGVEGRVARVSDKMKVVLSVDMIGQAISVTAQMDQIELL